MKNIDHFILIFCILLTACANVSPSPIATVTASSLPSATPGPTATPTPEATATQEAPKIAPYEQLLQLNYSKDYLDKFTNIHASTTFLYGNTFDSITGTDAKGKEVVLAVKWGIPELKKEGVWLQHYKMGRLEILMSPQINGYIDTSKVTEAQANAFVADYLARSKALTGDTRYDNVIKNNGDVIVVVASMDDNPFPGAGTGSVYLDGGNTKLYRTTGRGSSLISAWFPKDKASMVAMSFISKQLLNSTFTDTPLGPGPKGIYIGTALTFASTNNNNLLKGSSSKVFESDNKFSDNLDIVFFQNIKVKLVPIN